MIKEPKVSVEKKAARKPVVRRKPTQTAKSGGRKTVKAKSSTPKKQTQPRKLSDAAHYALMALGALIFVVGFYYFFIRPYSYRWKP